MNNTIFTSHYLTDWILTATTLVSFVISWKFRAHKQLFLIRIYIAASLFVDILSSVTELLYPESKVCGEIYNGTINFYSLLEISIIYMFISTITLGKRTRKCMKILYLIYILVCAILWIYFPHAIILNIHHLYSFEGVLITAICLLYFFELIQNDFHTDILENPQFIIICGILFYFSTTVPYYFTSTSLLEISPSFRLIYDCANYLFYTILFLSIIKAFLCPIPIQK